jgi:hypothetical protein
MSEHSTFFVGTRPPRCHNSPHAKKALHPSLFGFFVVAEAGLVPNEFLDICEVGVATTHLVLAALLLRVSCGELLLFDTSASTQLMLTSQ